MSFLKTASFGGLFGVTFVVAGTAQVAIALLLTVTAFLSPGFFRMGVTPASTPAQALGVVLMMTVFMLLMNAAFSAAGSGLWLLVRRWLPRGAGSTTAE